MKLDLTQAETLCVCVCVCVLYIYIYIYIYIYNTHIYIYINFNNKYIFFLVQKDMAISLKVHYKIKSLTV